MFDRKLLLGPGLAIALAFAPVAYAQSGQSGQSDTMGQTGQDTPSQPGTGTPEQGSQTGMVGQPGSSADMSTGDQSEVVRSATDVFRQVNQGNIPSNITQNAKAIAIFTSGSGDTAGAHGSMGTTGSTGTTGAEGTMGTTGSIGAQGSMHMSGQSARGLIVRRNSDGSWGRTPAFVRVSGASSTPGDLVLVFSSEEAIDALADGTLDLSSEVSVQAGPSGLGASMGTTGSTTGSTSTAGSSTDTTGMTGSTGSVTGSTGDTTGSTGSTGMAGSTTAQDTTTGTSDQSGRAVVYAYSRSMGSFTGTSITSGTITIDDSANQSAYGRQVSARELLSGDSAQSQIQASSVLQPFIDAVSSQSPSRAE